MVIGKTCNYNSSTFSLAEVKILHIGFGVMQPLVTYRITWFRQNQRHLSNDNHPDNLIYVRHVT